jgi:hypothetical protein
MSGILSKSAKHTRSRKILTTVKKKQAIETDAILELIKPVKHLL